MGRHIKDEIFGLHHLPTRIVHQNSTASCDHTYKGSSAKHEVTLGAFLHIEGLLIELHSTPKQRLPNGMVLE